MRNLPRWACIFRSWQASNPADAKFTRTWAKMLRLVRLYGFASRARHEAKCNDRPAAQLVAFAAAADRLAWELKWGDVAPQAKISKALPPTYDYAVSSLADAVQIAQRLELALGSALAHSKKCGGPVPRRIMRDAVVRLAELLEYYGGRFTHNPRIKTQYEGRPQTAAGHFVFEFLYMCDSSIIETAVSQFMAQAVRFRAPPAASGSREDVVLMRIRPAVNWRSSN